MSKFEISGGRKLYGEYVLQKAKNSVLTLMCASILTRDEVLIKDCPKISDVETMAKILKKIGAKVEWRDNGLYINTKYIFSTKLPERLTGEVRASFFLIGALLSRFKTASIGQPGGCSIGTRPIDIHLDGLRALGCEISCNENRMNFYAKELRGANIRLKYPSVGATENLMMASVFANGITVIENVAKEPEIKDLQDFLNLCGAKIVGAGSSVIKVEGVSFLTGGIEFTPIADRIECGSILLTVLSTGGEVNIVGGKAENVCNLLEKINNNTCKIYTSNDNIYIKAEKQHIGYGKVITAPYPLFATDLHPQLIASAISADGRTELYETVFDSRFSYAEELKKFGANIEIKDNRIIVLGTKIHPAKVYAKDLRGGMAQVIAGLTAEGISQVLDIHHIERGYENLQKKLTLLGAKIKLK